MDPGRLAAVAPNRGLRSLDVALVKGPKLTLLNTESCISALPVQGILSPDIAPGACQGLCLTHCPAEC